MPDAAKCSSCNADILWTLTAATGAKIPLDATPNPKGNIVLRDMGIRGERACVIGKADLFNAQDEVRYMPHHATCPDAQKYRKKK